MKKILLIALLTLSIFITGCGKEETKEIKEDLLKIDYNIEENETKLDKYDTKNPLVAMYIKNYGSIVIELYPDVAPNTVNNFISLVRDGFYDDNTMHRYVPDFVLQGGDPTGTGTGGPGYSIKGEFSSNDFENDLKHEEKIVSMARSQDPDSAGSQFFIMLGEAPHLDGEYAAFGKVIDGWDNVLNITENEMVSDQATGQLTNNLTIQKALIDLKDYEYKEVEKIEE